MNMFSKIFDFMRSKENKKKKYALILVLLLLGSFTALFVWNSYKSDNFVLPPLTEEEQKLLGEWKYTPNGPPLPYDHGYVLLPDHKCISRAYFVDTNNIKHENDSYLWWYEGGRLTVRAKYASTRELLAIGSLKWNRPLIHDTIYDLTPDGLGGFRAQESTRIEGTYDTPRATGSGKMVRVKRNGE